MERMIEPVEFRYRPIDVNSFTFRLIFNARLGINTKSFSDSKILTVHWMFNNYFSQ